ncbi:hypothetical protein, variant [Exophiala mesophila]|uniref:Uncharacterized protein n=1 Tax=Exophiala mesophila TaxID=212818 RepID=A0A0D1Y0U7_EXOME|nr:uncharacterized protein PV10_05275 [Exophiala mesophila]XP_016225701.1 hypothetical protein, variant [Exophiala mesophila]KIV94126.1 hypothetical protein PV10_05275 [Exophiala mesophila]KIV94127.1 hypothetical protein, variant [Exophiala mesophila]
MSIQLRLRLDDSFLDIEDACQTQPGVVRDSPLSALLLLPLDEENIQRIQLGEAFRHSLQAGRESTPCRLHSIISACKEGKIDDASLEARFFRHGGVRAVTALAAAGADDNNILSQPEGHGDEELGSFLKSIDTIKWHPDLEFMAEVTDRKRPSITTKETYLVRPRPPRSTKRANADKRTSHKNSGRFSRPARRTGPNAAERSNIGTQGRILSSDQSLSCPGSPEVAKQTSAEGCLSGDEIMAEC